jgi:hypothetical protein
VLRISPGKERNEERVGSVGLERGIGLCWDAMIESPSVLGRLVKVRDGVTTQVRTKYR